MHPHPDRLPDLTAVYFIQKVFPIKLRINECYTVLIPDNFL